MGPLVLSGLPEQLCNLKVTLLFGHLRIECIPVARLGFAGERLHQILLSPGASHFHNGTILLF